MKTRKNTQSAPSPEAVADAFLFLIGAAPARVGMRCSLAAMDAALRAIYRRQAGATAQH